MTITKYILISCLLIPLLSISQDYGKQDYGTLIVSKINSVYDGDTFRSDIDGIHGIIGDNIPIRVGGVDTPEIRGKCQYEKDLAIKARDFVREVLANAKTIELRNIDRGKYFRIVADVYVDDVNLTDLILKNNLGYIYDGGRKQSWCD